MEVLIGVAGISAFGYYTYLMYNKVMAVRFSLGGPTIESRPKKTRQGKSVNTILAPTSRNKRKKKYRGQGR